MAFKQRLIDLKDDPLYADDAELPHSETAWSVKKVKGYVDLYHDKFAEYDKIVNGISFDSLAKELRNAETDA